MTQEELWVAPPRGPLAEQSLYLRNCTFSLHRQTLFRLAGSPGDCVCSRCNVRSMEKPHGHGSIQNYSACWMETSKASLPARTPPVASGGSCKKNQERSWGFTNCLKRHCLIPIYSAGLIKILQEKVTSTIRAGSSSTQLHPVISRGLSAWQHNLTQPKRLSEGLIITTFSSTCSRLSLCWQQQTSQGISTPGTGQNLAGT